MSSVEQLNDALEVMRTALQADGYDLLVTADDQTTVVTVTAGPDACAECLIPKGLMLDMIRSAAPDISGHVDLIYPTEIPSH
jgi:hypothetical protein